MHRDIKPENVLLVKRDGRRGGALADRELPFERQAADTALVSHGAKSIMNAASSRFDTHNLGQKWRPKLSDMGLGKKLDGPSSSFRAAKSTISGTRGWQAPEVLRAVDRRAPHGFVDSDGEDGGLEGGPEVLPENDDEGDGQAPDDLLQEFGDGAASDAAAAAALILRHPQQHPGRLPAIDDEDDADVSSAASGDNHAGSPPRSPPMRSSGSASACSPLGPTGSLDPGADRLTRKVDIFSLGCLIHFVLDAGHHPFGRDMERDVRIRQARPSLDRLRQCPESQSLVRAMIDPNPRRRPSASEALEYPLFWTDRKRLEFLMALSDTIERKQKDWPTGPEPAVAARLRR